MPTSPPRNSGVVISAAPRSDGALSVVQVEWTSKRIVLSSGEETYTAYEKLLNLATWLCQEQAPVVVRLWPTKDGTELIELRRTDLPTDRSEGKPHVAF